MFFFYLHALHECFAYDYDYDKLVPRYVPRIGTDELQQKPKPTNIRPTHKPLVCPRVLGLVETSIPVLSLR